MRRAALLSLLCCVNILTAFGWGRKGHDVICYIAECHLTPRAEAQVKELLDGRSMVYYSSWADSAKHKKEFAYSRPWHYFSMEHRDSVRSAKRAEEGDLLSALEALESMLRDENVGREERSEALKIYIHLVGDLHQPMHLGREKDEGGALIPVIYFTDSTSLHAAWDYFVPMGVREWSYTEWQEQIDVASEAEMATIVSGDYASWIDQTHEITRQIYRDTPLDTRIFYDYIEKYNPVVEQQFLYGGLRLARMLNEIYK